MRKALNIITTVVLVIVLIFTFLLVGVRLFGLQPYTVISGSMEPNIHVGSIVYVKPAAASELTVDMPITYKMSNGAVVTHRIIEIKADERDPSNVSYITKGDANDDPDGTPVHISSVIGRVVFSIPVVGYVCHFIQNPPGSFITVAALMIFVILAFLPDLFLSYRAEVESAKEGKAAPEGESVDTAKLAEELMRLKEELSKRDAELAEKQSGQNSGGEGDSSGNTGG